MFSAVERQYNLRAWSSAPFVPFFVSLRGAYLQIAEAASGGACLNKANFKERGDEHLLTPSYLM